jgi:2-polyprenyl-3-methyl-5-hydroxy-6-metoxy-1,4-benzoquinol methylase
LGAGDGADEINGRCHGGTGLDVGCGDGMLTRAAAV